MKLYKYAIISLAAVALAACKEDDDKIPGNPVMQYDGLPSVVYFGDELPFTVTASDAEVPLSTVKAHLYINDELISSTSVRTKESGKSYSGTVSVPYYPYSEGLRGKLRLVLQNINFTTTETEVEFDIEYPDFPYLTLRSEDGTEYRLNRTAKSQYEATDEFPEDVRGILIAPAYGENGKEMTFGYSGEQIAAGGTSNIGFRSLVSGGYTISFNTYSYEFSPKGELKFDDLDFSSISPDEYQLINYFTMDQEIDPVGFPKFDDWWVDEDYFLVQPDGKLKFNAADGDYSVVADLANKYFTVKKTDPFGEPESLGADGSGTIWLMGTGAGKPDYINNAIGWVATKKQPFAPIGGKKFRMTFIAGKTLNPNKFTLRLFDQATGWGPTFTPARMTNNSSLLMMNVPGKEAHNIYLVDEATGLEPGARYEMIVDLSAGNDAAVLTFEKK